MKDSIVICIFKKKKKKPTGVNAVVGIIKSACVEDQCSKAKSESQSKTFSWTKQANHCQLWLDLYIITSQVLGGRSKMWTLKTKTDFTPSVYDCPDLCWNMVWRDGLGLPWWQLVLTLALLITSPYPDAIPLWCLRCLRSHYQQAFGLQR